MKTTATPISLRPDERLSRVSKEHHVRKQNGRLLAYILEDKWAQHLILSQKLSTLAEYVNTFIVHDRPDQVSVSGLHQIISCKGGRTGGWTKHRWRCQPFALETAAAAFESVREQGFEHCVVLGDPECYQTQSVA